MNTLQQFKQIKTFIFDVDGVLTNSDLLVTESGELLRVMNTRDGYALKKAVNLGYNVCIITGGKSKGVASRLQGLGIEDIFLGASDKLSIFNQYQKDNSLKFEEILYMGDDLVDIEVMKKVGLATCPADATQEVKSISHYVSKTNGGAGCAREIIEMVLKLNDQWPYQKASTV